MPTFSLQASLLSISLTDYGQRDCSWYDLCSGVCMSEERMADNGLIVWPDDGNQHETQSEVGAAK